MIVVKLPEEVYDSWKNSGLYGIRTHDLCDTGIYRDLKITTDGSQENHIEFLKKSYFS